MRVVVVAEQLRRGVPGGIGTYVRGLAQGMRALGADGPDLTLWASRAPGRGTDPVAALGPLVTSPLPGPVLVWAWDRGLGGFGGRADVVHATSLAVPPRRRAPVTAMVHDLAWRRVPDAYPTRGRRWHEAALGRAVARASVLVTPSSATADDLVGAGADPLRVEVVEEGADHLPAPDHASAHARLRQAGVDGPYLLTVSTLEPRKNLGRLVAAYHAARPRLPEAWPLVVVGPSGWGEQAPPAGEGVVLAGPVEAATLAALYARARVVAYVPLVEGFGLPAVEAMAAGAPVVASPMPSTGGAALEVDP
ncbi:MAG TPA: glycosyltransferase family 1 protein, partial [Acidimicrobiales bacterium]|nr:glycosyltransferase family 1 protein [Acidimicrobiales bacterium]